MALNEGKLTQAGLRLMAKVPAGATVKITKFAVGDGELGSRDPLLLSDLVNRLYNYSVTRIGYNNNVATVTFNFTNQSVTTGFYWREVGMWAIDPDVGEILFMYASSTGSPEYIPPGGSSTILERQFNWRLVGSNAASITAKIDQSLMYASQDDLAALAKQSLQVRTIDAAYKTLAEMQQPGVYHISQVSNYSDRPVYEDNTSASGPATLLVKRNPALTTTYDFMQMIEIAVDTFIHVFIRRVVVASGTTTAGGWVRDINASGGTFTGSVTMNKTLTIKGKINGSSGSFSDVVEITGAVPLIFKHPTSTTTRSWITHIESSNAGGYLHFSPEKSDASGWDFDKGIRIDGGTGDLYVKNGLTGPNSKTWINPQRSSGNTPSYTLTIGDSDTGINWVREGNLELRSNGEILAFTLNESGTKGLFAPTSDGNANYHLANEIQSLKQSGVDTKKRLVDALNAKRLASKTDESFSTLTDRVYRVSAPRDISLNGDSSTMNNYDTDFGTYVDSGTRYTYASILLNSPGDFIQFTPNLQYDSTAQFYCGSGGYWSVTLRDNADRAIDIYPGYRWSPTGAGSGNRILLQLYMFSVDRIKRTLTVMRDSANSDGSSIQLRQKFYSSIPSDFNLNGPLRLRMHIGQSPYQANGQLVGRLVY